MGLIEMASGKSVWRGMDYYECKKVTSWNEVSYGIYEGIVLGSEGEKYSVYIETMHPKKSVCNCAFADGRRVICKHMIALYFTAEPEAAADFLHQVQEWEKEEEEQEKQHYLELREYVNSLTKAELKERLYEALVELEDARHRNW